MTSGETVLSARGVSRSFGAQVALDHVDLDLRAGEIVALLGSNGAGKSTLVKILTGSDQPDAGNVQLDRQVTRFASMLDAADKGIATVTQELTLFPDLTVIENLELVRPVTGLSRSEMRARTEEVFRALELTIPLRSRVERLSLAEQQKLEIARATLRRPRVLVLDEPTSSLHRDERARLQEVIRDLRATGVAILYVTHYLEEAVSVADRVFILRDGVGVATLDRDEGMNVETLVALMTGRASRAQPTCGARFNGDTRPGLHVAALRLSHGPELRDFRAQRGEIVGFAGLDDAGVVPLLQGLFGMGTAIERNGTTPAGHKLPQSPFQAVRHAIAYVPSDRKSLGLMLDQSVRENMNQVGVLTLGRHGLRSKRALETRCAMERCDHLGVKAASVDIAVRSLSGGHQQKVVLGKWLNVEPDVLILDDPTRGVDIKGKADIHEIIRRMSEAGAVILLHSTDPKELLGLSDRILIYCHGFQIEENPAAFYDENSITAAMNRRLAAQSA